MDVQWLLGKGTGGATMQTTLQPAITTVVTAAAVMSGPNIALTAFAWTPMQLARTVQGRESATFGREGDIAPSLG